MNEPDKEPLQQTKPSALMNLNLSAERSRPSHRMVNAIRSLSG